MTAPRYDPGYVVEAIGDVLASAREARPVRLFYLVVRAAGAGALSGMKPAARSLHAAMIRNGGAGEAKRPFYGCCSGSD
jgi:hypothetical protein